MENKVLAVVAGTEITDAELDAFLQSAPPEQQPYVTNPKFRQQYLEQLMTLHMFAQMGEDEKLNETEAFKAMVESAKRDILAQLAMKETLKDVEVTEEEMETFYRTNHTQFTKPETVSAKHILVEDEEKCSAVLEAIVNGEKTFEDAAKEVSTCPSKERGGDLGEFGRGQMVKEFEDAAFDAEVDHVVGPVKTQFGYHLIKVEKKNEASVAAYDEVKDMIKKNLTQQKQGEAYSAKVNELKAKYVTEK